MIKKTVKNNSGQVRPPVVVILGHVDHGKTSILDYIRQTRVAEKESGPSRLAHFHSVVESEAGGITQHIGAYQVEHQNKKITFLDTPGHEAFSAMRSRGAKVADIAVLVVAAEEGVKPQTKEAIDHIKKAGLPAIIALNKIDKKEALPEKVKKQLADNGLAPESLGGATPSINLSAKTGQGIDGLLEMINLVAEMEELKYQPDQPASGVVIESRCEAQRGNTATILVKEGTLHNKDIIGTDSALGRLKTMEDFRFQPLTEAPASTPVIVTGFDRVPQVGEKFMVFESLKQAQARVDKKTIKRKGEEDVFVIEPGKKILNLILKADVHGCLEAIENALKSIPSEEAILRIIKAEAGTINESDIKLAESAQARIIGFKIKTSSAIRQIAQRRKVKIFTYEVIYELIQGVREQLAKLLAPEIIRNVLGQLKVLGLFRAEKDRQIVGGKVVEGQARQGALIEIIRENKKIGQGKIVQLQRDKKEIDEVNKGQECGVLFQGDVVIEKGDLLEFYQEEKKKREL